MTSSMASTGFCVSRGQPTLDYNSNGTAIANAFPKTLPLFTFPGQHPNGDQTSEFFPGNVDG